MRKPWRILSVIHDKRFFSIGRSVFEIKRIFYLSGFFILAIILFFRFFEKFWCHIVDNAVFLASDEVKNCLFLRLDEPFPSYRHFLILAFFYFSDFLKKIYAIWLAPLCFSPLNPEKTLFFRLDAPFQRLANFLFERFFLFLRFFEKNFMPFLLGDHTHD